MPSPLAGQLSCKTELKVLVLDFVLILEEPIDRGFALRVGAAFGLLPVAGVANLPHFLI